MPQDEYYMQLALKEAEKAYAMGEVPVGAVLVWNNEVIAQAHNRVETEQDATAHAELLCMVAGAAKLNNWRLLNTTLYSTLEPCAMCAGAMLLSRIPTLVWGAPDKRHGAHGSFVNLLDQPHPTHQIEVRQGILAEACGQLMRSFFQNRRKQTCC